MDAALGASLIELELSLLTPEARGCAERLEALLAPDFVEFGASGRRFSRADIVAELASEDTTTSSAARFECIALGEGLVQLRYVSEARSAAGLRRARRSSLWRRDQPGWRMVFHQGTPVSGDLHAC
jgi:hypothetical protein